MSILDNLRSISAARTDIGERVRKLESHKQVHIDSDPDLNIQDLLRHQMKGSLVNALAMIHGISTQRETSVPAPAEKVEIVINPTPDHGTGE